MGPDTLNRAISKLFGREPGRKKQPPNKMGKLEHFTVHDLRRTFRNSTQEGANMQFMMRFAPITFPIAMLAGFVCVLAFFDGKRSRMPKRPIRRN